MTNNLKVLIIGNGLFGDFISSMVYASTIVDVAEHIGANEYLANNSAHKQQMLAGMDLVIVCTSNKLTPLVLETIPGHICVLDTSQLNRDNSDQFILYDRATRFEANHTRYALPGCIATIAQDLLDQLRTFDSLYLDTMIGSSVTGRLIEDHGDFDGVKMFCTNQMHPHSAEIARAYSNSPMVYILPKLVNMHSGIMITVLTDRSNLKNISLDRGQYHYEIDPDRIGCIDLYVGHEPEQVDLKNGPTTRTKLYVNGIEGTTKAYLTATGHNFGRLAPMISGLMFAIFSQKLAKNKRFEQGVWYPIELAPKDNVRPLMLARFDPETNNLLELDYDGIWEYWEESWEMSHINGWTWMSANGIEEPTHWMYQIGL